MTLVIPSRVALLIIWKDVDDKCELMALSITIHDSDDSEQSKLNSIVTTTIVMIVMIVMTVMVVMVVIAYYNNDVM